MLSGSKSLAQETVYGSLQAVSGTADLCLDQSGYVVVERQSSSHIMMLR
jgi:hypothetical protein